MMSFRSLAAFSALGVVGLLFGLGAAGCQSGASGRRVGAAGRGQPTNEVHAANVLRPGDRIRVVFSGIPVPPPIHMDEITADGFIKPPLLNAVKAAGKTSSQLQDDLQGLYVPAFFKAITINVTIEERYFFVGGEVKLPGQKPYLSTMTVVKAIQAAGDFTDFANRTSVLVTRADGTKLEVNCKKAIRNRALDIPIYPGDTINVPRRFP
jgi:protein involved in polysaccharide export with SLBB domain